MNTNEHEYNQSVARSHTTGKYDVLARGVLFWVFALAGAVCFSSAAVWPAWMEYEAQARQRDRLAQRVKQLERNKREGAELIDAVQSDPSVAERIALKELGYRRPGEAVLPVRHRSGAVARNNGEKRPILCGSPMVREVGRRLHRPRFRGLLGLAGGVLVFLAFLMFPVCEPVAQATRRSL